MPLKEYLRPASDMETLLRNTGRPLFSLESRAPINRFDIIGFSLLYELNYTNVLTILDLGQIPFLASDRDQTHPIIIAGGPCVCNPEPVADIFDAMVVGDGEKVIREMAAEWLDWRKARVGPIKQPCCNDGRGLRESIFRLFSRPASMNAAFKSWSPGFQITPSVKRAVVEDLNRMPFPDKPIIPYGKPVHDRLRLEVSRGCTRGCRFCQAGMIYRPVRERSPEQLMSLAASSIAATGYEDISLLSLSTGDYGCIAPLMERLMGSALPPRMLPFPCLPCAPVH